MDTSFEHEGRQSNETTLKVISIEIIALNGYKKIKI